MAGYFLRDRHERRPARIDRFDRALAIAHRWFLDRIGQVATIQYLTVPIDLAWWQPDGPAPLISGGIDADGTVAMTLYRKFIEMRVRDHDMLPDVLYELLVTEWATLTGQTVAEVDPEF